MTDQGQQPHPANTDLDRAIVLLCAVMDDDDDPLGAAAMVMHADPLDLCMDVLDLCVQLGRVAYGSDDALRSALHDSLMRDVEPESEQP